MGRETHQICEKSIKLGGTNILKHQVLIKTRYMRFTFISITNDPPEQLQREVNVSLG